MGDGKKTLIRRAPRPVAAPAEPAPAFVSRDPLHGVTLQAMVERLHAEYGWAGLARRVPVACFQNEPSVPSSLKFLRRVPWARAKVEALYLDLVTT